MNVERQYAIVIIRRDQIQDVTFPSGANIGVEVHDYTDYVVHAAHSNKVFKMDQGEAYVRTRWEPGRNQAEIDLTALEAERIRARQNEVGDLAARLELADDLVKLRAALLHSQRQETIVDTVKRAVTLLRKATEGLAFNEWRQAEALALRDEIQAFLDAQHGKPPVAESERVSRRPFRASDVAVGQRYRDARGRIWIVWLIHGSTAGEPGKPLVCTVELEAEDDGELLRIMDVDLRQHPWERVPMIDKQKETDKGDKP